MIALLSAVLAASLVGSLHCAAMCGPLQGLFVDPTHARRARWTPALAHALGRLIGYALLGAVAGGVGAIVDLAGEVAALQQVAMIVAGLAVIGWGVVALAAALGVRLPRLHPRVWTQALVQIRRRPPRNRAVLLGLLSAALPCGWLWAFVVVAAGTGSVAGGAAVMATFWLGTVPTMVGLGALTGGLVRWIGPRLPFVTAAVLIAVGVVALTARVPVLHAGVGGDADAPARGVPTAPACHGASR